MTGKLSGIRRRRKDPKEPLGHADIRTIQRYLHADEEQIRKIVEKMGR